LASPQGAGSSSSQATSTARDWIAQESARAASDEAAWRSRARQARSRVASLEAEARELDAKATSSAYGFATRPCHPPNRIREREDEQKIEDGLKRIQNAPLAQEAARTSTMDRLASAREQLAAARRAVDDLAEEARRANVPPGWLRE